MNKNCLKVISRIVTLPNNQSSHALLHTIYSSYASLNRWVFGSFFEGSQCISLSHKLWEVQLRRKTCLQRTFIPDPIVHEQPMELFKIWCNMGRSGCSCDKTCCCILNALEPLHQMIGNPIQQPITIVQS